jgi:molybdopterin-guanine dinucleotide biosynthesis protein A
VDFQPKAARVVRVAAVVSEVNFYVLIGGRSSRMGEPKAGLRLGGRSFLERVRDAALPVFDEIVAVARPGGGDLPLTGMRIIFETPHREEGPVFGLIRALEDAGERAWVSAVDYPLLTPEILRSLSDRFVASGSLMLVPRWSNRMQMLCAGYSKAMLPIIRDRVAAERYDLRGVADPEWTTIVDESELRRSFAGEPLRNVNTPDELEEVRSMA